MSFDVYTALLKMFDEFHTNSDGVNLCFDLTNPKLQEIRLKYGLDNIVGEGNNFTKVTNLLFWLSKNCYHNGNFDNNGDLNPINLLEYSFQKGKEFGINCKCLSTILTECLLSLDFMARTMFIMPFSPYDYDNHVVTHVFINELNKWIMLDPTYGCYIMDKDKNPLNIFEIRELLANQDYIVFNKEMKYNDKKLEEDSFEHKVYYAKNLFYFMTREKSCFNSESDSRIISIAPSVLDVKKREIQNMEYKLKKQDDVEWIKEWLKNINEYKYFYTTPSEVLNKL